MTAFACLKILIGDALRFGDPEEMADLAAKLAGSYLDTIWRWPRRHGLVAPYTFVLADPRATALDARELQALAQNLQLKLFGEHGDGEVTLLMFEGDQADIMRFAGLALSDLSRIAAGKNDHSLIGRVCKITSDEVTSIAPRGGSVAGRPPMEEFAREPQAPQPARVVYRGVYHTGRETFIGSVALWREADVSADEFTLPRADGNRPEHDILALRAASEAAARLRSGIMFFPISFSSIIRPGARAELASAVQALPNSKRGQLAAAVYDTPRAPTYWALSQLKAFLAPHFNRIDLRVSDPAFQVENLPSDITDSVTLALPQGSEATRLAAIGRFLGQAVAYRRHRALQGVSDVRTRRELSTCVQHAAPFLTGPAISDFLEAPTVGVNCALRDLPFSDWNAKQTVLK